MKRHYITALALTFLASLPNSANAAIDNPAKDWQLQSLKGITSIDYGVAYDANGKLIKIVTDGLSGVGVPLRSISFKKDTEDTPLSPTAAQLKVFVDDRDDGKKCWVGLNIRQKAKLDRNPKIVFDAQTYAIGTLCAKSEVDAKLKEVCAQFVSDFKAKSK
jgi:hypothetical protein